MTPQLVFARKMQLLSHAKVVLQQAGSVVHTFATQVLHMGSRATPASQSPWAQPQAAPQAVVVLATQSMSQLLMQHCGSSLHKADTQGLHSESRGSPVSHTSCVQAPGGQTPQSAEHAWQFSLMSSHTLSPQTGGQTPQSASQLWQFSGASHMLSPQTGGQFPQSSGQPPQVSPELQTMSPQAEFPPEPVDVVLVVVDVVEPPPVPGPEPLESSSPQPKLSGIIAIARRAPAEKERVIGAS
jgi:hypothetical protein